MAHLPGRGREPMLPVREDGDLWAWRVQPPDPRRQTPHREA